MLIQVTAADIKGAKRGNTTNCMLGKALHRQFPDHWFSVGVWTMSVMPRADYSEYDRTCFGDIKSLAFPEDVKEKIISFEQGGKVKPFSFEWDVEFPSIKPVKKAAKKTAKKPVKKAAKKAAKKPAKKAVKKAVKKNGK